MASKNLQNALVSFGKGIHRNPSIPVDGELSECVNLLPKGEELTGMPMPADTGMQYDAASNERPLCVHHVAGKTHYITRVDNWGKRKPTLNYEFVLVMEDTGVMLYTNYVQDGADIEVTVNYRLGTETVKVALSGVSCVLPLIYNRRWNKIQSATITGLPLSPASVAVEVIDNIGKDPYVYTATPVRVVRYTLAYFTESDVDRVVILSTNAKPEQVLPYGNMLAIRYTDRVDYALYRDGEYRSLGSNLPEIDVPLALTREFVSTSSVGLVSMEDGGKSVINYDNLICRINDAAAKSRGANNWSAGAYYGATSNVDLTTKLEKGTTYQFENNSMYDVLIVCYLPKSQYMQNFVVRKGQKSRIKITYDTSKLYYTSNGYHGGSTFVCSVGIYAPTTQQGMVVPSNTSDNLQAVMGMANEYLAHAMSDSSNFVLPFFARVGLRLYDGTISRLSAPVLLVPNSGTAPSLIVLGDQPGDYPGITFAVQSKLQYKLSETDRQNLLAWKDLIRSIVICVTAPIYTYNEGYTYQDDKVNIKSHKISVSEGVVAGLEEAGFTVSGATSEEGNYIYSERMLSELLVESGLISSSEGSYQQIELPKFNDNEIRAHYTEQSGFYVLHEVDLSDLVTGWTTVDTQGRDLLNIPTYEAVPDDNRSHDQICPSVLFSYNSRLHYANSVERLWSGTPLALQTGYQQDPSSAKTYALRTIVEVSLDGQTAYAGSGWGEECTSGDVYWLYYPNANAKRAVVYIRETSGETVIYSKAEVILTTHKFLDGAYWFDNYEFLQSQACDESEANTAAGDNTLHWPNKLYVSEANNPWSFPTTQRITVGTGSILDLSTTAAALSQNPYGRSVLQAFCSDGIWELETSDTGRYLAKNPTSRDVLTGETAMLDGAIAFPTAQGLKLLSSQGIRLMSDALDGYNVPESNPNIAVVLKSAFGADTPLVTDTAMFREVLPDCFFSYDYPHQVLHVFFSDSESWHYVVDLQTGEWAIQNLPYAVKAVFTDYPNSYLCGSDGKIYRHQIGGHTEPVKGYALTRPISFGDPTARKQLYDVRSISQLVTGESGLRLAVYVSNDALNWYALPSLKTGSAKYYRLLIVTSMTETDTLKGLSIQYVERFTGKMR